MLNEFGWVKEESEGDSRWKDSEVLDCQIGITPEGKFAIYNHNDPSQYEEFETAEELGQAISQTLNQKINR